MRIVFIGSGEIAVPTLRWLRDSDAHKLVAVVTQPDKPAGRNQQLTPPPVKLALTAAGALASQDRPLMLQPEKIKAPEVVTQVRELAPDVLVVMAYGQILPRAILEIPKLACLNLHASLLPRWRGAAPIQAAIAAGDRESGITVMYVDEGLDTGDILLQRKVQISLDETGGSLHDKFAEIAPLALNGALELLVKSEAPRIRQENALATYAPKLSREDGRIDWNEPAEVIERKIRAFNPWPGAFTELNGRILKILRAKIVPKESTGFVFQTATEAIAPTEVQLEGSRRMSAEEFLRGHRFG